VSDRDGRTEKATGKRRAEARKRGQVARSSDLNSAIGVLAVFSVLAFSAPKLLGEFENMLTRSLGQSGNWREVTTVGIWPLMLSALESFATIVAPIFGVALVAGLVANVAQVKLKWSMEALKPRFSHLNPKSGLKRLFGTSGLVETGKALVKLVAIGGVAFAAVWAEIPHLGSLVGIPPQELATQIGTRIQSIAFEVIAVLLVLSAADLFWQRHKLEKSMMMTKEEVKQEARQTDISPEVRGAIRKRQYAQFRKRMMAQVPTADVVVVNPTHYAVALRYDPALPAPQLVAKGVDHVAAAIRRIAEENGVPLVSNPPLARTLYRDVELDAMVPEALFVAVAQVLAYVFRTARGRRRTEVMRSRRERLPIRR
jgi:flagellar biosynthetic protein FlhB